MKVTLGQDRNYSFFINGTFQSDWEVSSADIANEIIEKFLYDDEKKTLHVTYTNDNGSISSALFIEK